MEYTIKKLAKLAGVTTRTLRYYDEIGLLRPAYVTNAGYRMYSGTQVDILQHILFYRALDMELGEIKSLIHAPDFNQQTALEKHLVMLKAKRDHMEGLITTVEKTITAMKGSATMSDAEKFEGFKQKMIDENEEKYGDEVRDRWGADSYKASQQKVKNMSKEQWKEVEALSQEVNDALKAAVEEGDPAGELAQKACDLHRQWLCYFWADGMYSKEAHKGLAEMYCQDERFKAYYEKIAPGTAEFFREAMDVYTR
jgi:DNA-binding transcriptional MerR regulator